MAKREGRWDCPTCGTKGNLGRHKNCPNCGADVPKTGPFNGSPYYLPLGEPPVSEPNLLYNASAGPDWICAHCSASNPGYRVNCRDCGAPLGTSPSRAVISYAESDVPRGTTEEKEWTCANCGTHNPENRSACQSCGVARDETGIEKYNREASGYESPQPEPEWSCTNCGAHNPESRVTCKNCGVRRGETGYQKYNREAAGTTVRSSPPASVGSTLDRQTGDLTLSANRNWLYYAGVAVAIVAILFGVWFLFIRTIEKPLTVAGFHWERTVTIEQYATHREGGWSIPSGARLISQELKFSHNRQVFDHYDTVEKEVCKMVPDGTRDEPYQDCDTVPGEEYACGNEDLGNGYFGDKMCTRDKEVCTTKYRPVPHEKQQCDMVPRQIEVTRPEPVYETWYTYDVDRWSFSQSPKAAGNDHNAYWPNSSLSSNERVSGRIEKYIVYFIDDEGKEFQYETNFDRWQGFEQGQRVLAKINTVGQIVEIKNEEK